MLIETVTLLLTGLNRFILAEDGAPLGSADVAVPGNPAQIDIQNPVVGLANQILLTVLNIEEEAALKNGQTTFVAAGQVAVRHRPVHLNLFLLFAANYDNYSTALQRLGQVVTYFQGQKRFDPGIIPGALPNLPPETELSVTMELVTLTLEEMNHVWGAIGGQALPYAAYRARVVILRQEGQAAGGGLVREIDVDLHDTTAELV